MRIKERLIISIFIYRSECYCGNHLPTKTKRREENIEISKCCSWTCSGQLNETCGGDLCNSVYAVNSTTQKNFSEYF
jgi:hypothetical protein